MIWCGHLRSLNKNYLRLDAPPRLFFIMFKKGSLQRIRNRLPSLSLRPEFEMTQVISIRRESNRIIENYLLD